VLVFWLVIYTIWCGLKLFPRYVAFTHFPCLRRSTPYDIAYQTTLPPESPFNSSVGFLGTMEYLVVVCFAIDIVVRFFTPVFVEATGTWIKDPRVIAYKYATSWLIIDIISTLPWDNVCDATGCRSAAGFNFLGILRLLRTLRSNRVLRLWERQVFVPYAWINLLRFIVMILFSGHYMACILRLIPVFEFGPDADLSRSWLGTYEVENSHPRRQYILALYHSIMTLSTVGYGDVVMQTDAELWFSILAMLVGVSLYAYIVGEVTTLISWMRRSRTEFENQMDTLGSLVKLTQFNRGDRVFLRHFLFNSRGARAHEWRMSMLMGLSPALRAKAMLQLHGDWLLESKLFGPLVEQYVRSGLSTLQLASPPAMTVQNSLASESEALLAMLVSSVRVTSYAPYEVIVRPGSIADRMYAVFAGVVVSEGLVKTRGTVFGEDFLLTRHQRRYFLTALKFTVLGELDHSVMYTALHSGNFENARMLYNRLRVTLAWHRRWLPHVRRLREELDAETLDRSLLNFLMVPATRVFAPSTSRSLFKRRNPQAVALGGDSPTPTKPPPQPQLNLQPHGTILHVAAAVPHPAAEHRPAAEVAPGSASAPLTVSATAASVTEEDLESQDGTGRSQGAGTHITDNPLSPPANVATPPLHLEHSRAKRVKGASTILEGSGHSDRQAFQQSPSGMEPERVQQLRRRFLFNVSIPGASPPPSDVECAQLCAWFGVPLEPARNALERARSLFAAGRAAQDALAMSGFNTVLDSGAE